MPELERIASEHEFNTPLMYFLIAYAQAAEWDPTKLPPQFEQLVKGPITGISQSLINEEANKLIRDGDKRDTASGTVRYARMWALPTNGKLLERYGREEVKPTTQFKAPHDKRMLERLFADTVDAPLKATASEKDKSERRVKEEWDTKIRSVVGLEKVENTWNPRTAMVDETLLCFLPAFFLFSGSSLQG
jgi:hypothetical protein